MPPPRNPKRKGTTQVLVWLTNDEITWNHSDTYDMTIGFLMTEDVLQFLVDTNAWMEHDNVGYHFNDAERRVIRGRKRIAMLRKYVPESLICSLVDHTSVPREWCFTHANEDDFEEWQWLRAWEAEEP